jgi:hypothetical protein
LYTGQTALDLAKDEQMRQVLSVQPIRRLLKSATTFEGMLLKRSRFLGWKPLWVSQRLKFELQNLSQHFNVFLNCTFIIETVQNCNYF